MPCNLHVPAATIKHVLLNKLLPLDTGPYSLNNPSNLLHSALMESLANKSSLQWGETQKGMGFMHAPKYFFLSFHVSCICSLNHIQNYLGIVYSSIGGWLLGKSLRIGTSLTGVMSMTQQVGEISKSISLFLVQPFTLPLYLFFMYFGWQCGFSFLPSINSSPGLQANIHKSLSLLFSYPLSVFASLFLICLVSFSGS